jgi:hypothetical protein
MQELTELLLHGGVVIYKGYEPKQDGTGEQLLCAAINHPESRIRTIEYAGKGPDGSVSMTLSVWLAPDAVKPLEKQS